MEDANTIHLNFPLWRRRTALETSEIEFIVRVQTHTHIQNQTWIPCHIRTILPYSPEQCTHSIYKWTDGKSINKFSGPIGTPTKCVNRRQRRQQNQRSRTSEFSPEFENEKWKWKLTSWSCFLSGTLLFCKIRITFLAPATTAASIRNRWSNSSIRSSNGVSKSRPPLSPFSSAT